jgi:hypothetical protein
VSKYWMSVISYKKLDIKLTFEMLAKCLLIDSSVGSASQAPKILKVVTNEKGEAVGEVVTIIC